MGAANGVVAVFLQQAHLALHRVGPAGSTQGAVVVVDAGPSQDDPLAVDSKALVRSPLDGTGAEGTAGLVAVKPGTAGVQPGTVGAPGLQARSCDGKGRLTAIAFRLPAAQGPAAVQQFHCDGAAAHRLYRNLQPHRVQCQGANAQRPGRQIVFTGGQVQPHRAVDARAGIPAAVGLVCIAGNDLQRVFTAVVQGIIHGAEKAAVPVGAAADLSAIQKDLSVAVDALKLQDGGPAAPVLRRVKLPYIAVIMPFKPAGVDAAGTFFGAGLGQHGVVGQKHRAQAVLAQAGKLPAGVPIDLPHKSFSFRVGALPEGQHGIVRCAKHPFFTVLFSGYILQGKRLYDTKNSYPVAFCAQAVFCFVQNRKASPRLFGNLPSPGAALGFWIAVRHQSCSTGIRTRSSNQPFSAWTVTEPPYFSTVAWMLFRP